MIAKITRPDFYDGDRVVTLSAKVTSGEVIKTKELKFLIRHADRTNQQALAEDLAYIKKNIPSIVKGHLPVMSELTLPCGSTAVWTSTDAAIIAIDGTVNRPDFGLPSEDVTLTVTLTYGEETVEGTMAVTVLALSEEDELNVMAKKLTWDMIKGTNVDKARITSNLTLMDKFEGVEDIAITWKSSDISYVDNTGVVTRPEYNTSDVQITLTATLTKNNKSVLTVFNGLKVLKKSPSSTQRCEEYVGDTETLNRWATANGTNGNIDIKNIIEGFVLPAENDDMLVTWSVVNSAGEPATTNYFKVEYVDDSSGEVPRVAEQARRYVATVTRPASNNVQTYLKVTATISETEIEGVQVPGGTASYIHPIIILQEEGA